MIKKTILIIFILLPFALVEFISFAVIKSSAFGSYGFNKSMYRIDYFRSKTGLNDFVKTHFCDFMHMKELGHSVAAKNLVEKIDFEKFETGWFFGGSTTEGSDCDRSQKNFVDYVNEHFSPNKEFENFARSGAFSDNSIRRLKKLLEERAVDLVVWGHWINEYLVQGDPSDLNYEILAKKFTIREVNRNDVIRRFFLRLNYTLYTYSNTFRLFQNFHSTYNRSSFSFLYSIHQSEKFEHYIEEDIDFFPSSFVSKNDWIEYSLRNTHLNLKELLKLSDEHGFKVVLLKLPHVRNLYKEEWPELDDFLESWYENISNLYLKTGTEYGWQFIDLQDDFLILQR